MHLQLPTPISEAFVRQAKTCMEMGAPLTGRICQLLGLIIDDSTVTGRMAIGWPEATLRGDLLPLRLCGALNALVRNGLAPALARHYPPNAPGDEASLAGAIRAALSEHDDLVARFIKSAPQTNEVMRSGVLLAAFALVAQETRMPLHLHELGASAGLNLLFDNYWYDLGEGRNWGPADAKVQISCRWSGPAAALNHPIPIASRVGVDLNPISARISTDRERLLAYVWPEQAHRVQRIEAALEKAASLGLEVERGDALAWAQERLKADQAEYGVRVVFHSVFMQYLPQHVRQDLRSILKAAGERATKIRPFAWISMEADASNPIVCQLVLTLWPGGERRVIADVDWHGKSARFNDRPI